MQGSLSKSAIMIYGIVFASLCLSLSLSMYIYICIYIYKDYIENYISLYIYMIHINFQSRGADLMAVVYCPGSWELRC